MAANETNEIPPVMYSRGPRTLSHAANVRILNGHTQASLAQASETSPRTIARIEKGSTPSVRTATRIAACLGTTISAIWPELEGPA
jgi:DNA-binding XRE family transcriptional regulator